MPASPSQTPLSICIPTWEPRPSDVAGAVESALACGPDVEVLVCDDASTNRAEWRERVERLGAEVALHDRRLGMAGNWNRAVRATRGPWVVVLGQDDLLLPQAVRERMDLVRDVPELVLAGGGRVFVDAEGRPLEPRLSVHDRAHIFPDDGWIVLSSGEVVELCLTNGNALGEPSALVVRRAAFEAVGGFREAYRHSADVDFILRMSARGPVGYFCRPVLRRRRHAGNLTRRNFTHGIVSRERVRLLAEHGGALAGEAVGDARGYLAAKSVYDAVRHLQGLRPGRALRSGLRALRYALASPPGLTREVGQLVTGRNRRRVADSGRREPSASSVGHPWP